jgi:PTH1 family peptidyl-tRNA hydrolase
VRAGGSSAGHQGLQNVIDCLGTTEFPRLRLGVRGVNFRGGEALPDYVLDRFSKAERSVIGPAIDQAGEAVEVWATEGIGSAMNRFNRSPEESPES